MRYAHPGTPGALVSLKSAYGNFIDGKFVEPIGGEFFMNTSPVDGSNIGQFPRSDAKDIDFALDAAHRAADAWGKTSAQHRANLLLQVAESLESKQLSHEIESYFAVAIYKVYRYLYMADPAGVDAVFRAPQDRFEYLCDARMKEHELKIRLAANGEEGCGLTQENIRRMPLAPSEIARRYPDLSSALLTVLQQVSDSIDRKNKMQ